MTGAVAAVTACDMVVAVKAVTAVAMVATAVATV